MPTVDLHTRTGDTSGSVELDAKLFDAPLNVPAMHQVVTAQLASARAGTSKVKNRATVKGTNKKPWRQKGTGRARQGTLRGPHFVGGAVAHGPTGVENYTKRVPKKLKKVALRSALSDRARSGDVRVVADLAFDRPRTKDAVAFLQSLGLSGRRVLLVLARRDEAIGKSFRNLREVHLLTVDQLNTYDVLVSDVVVFQQDALPLIGLGSQAEAPTADAAHGEGATTSAAPTEVGTGETGVDTA